MVDRFCPILKTRALIDETIFDISRYDKNSERYVIPMHRENFWTKKWIHDPRNNLLHVSYYDPSA
jgi:folate-dependent tRNA-U54 methylase TrmFO/GidA